MTMIRTHSVSKTLIRWNELYPVLCLIFLATSPVIFLGEGNRNLGLIALMFVAPLFILRRTLEADVYLLGFAFSIVIFPALVHSGGTRWSTIFYTLMFCGFFISYDGMLRRRMFRLATFVKIIRYLIIAYTVVLIIQQLCVLVGLPIFNLSNYDPSNRWKLNSLSAEPSHSARIVGLLMLSYSLGMGLLGGADRNLKVSQRQDIGLWLCFFWTMITMLSATAVAMIVIVLLTNAQGKSLHHRYHKCKSIVRSTTRTPRYRPPQCKYNASMYPDNTSIGDVKTTRNHVQHKEKQCALATRRHE